MVVRAGRSRRGQSSTRKSAVPTAIGTPIKSATADVISVPTTSGRASKMLCATSQLLPNTKSITPNFANTGCASTYRRMKKKPRRTSTPTASPVRPTRIARSGRRESGDRPRRERSPPVSVVAPASICPVCPQRTSSALAGCERLAVALQSGHRLLGFVEQLWRVAGVCELRRRLLAVAQRVVQEPGHVLCGGLVKPRLAHVLVDHQVGG